MERWALGWAVLLAAVLGARLAACSQPAQPQGFIRVEGGRFVDDRCQEFVPHGWNGWLFTTNAVSNPASIEKKFAEAQAAGLNIARLFLADDESGVTLLRGPADIDETVARGLDFIIAEAAKHGIRLTLVLLNLWKPNNGVPTFEKWCGTAGSYTRPRPDIDPRGSLSPLDRLQMPYDWFVSPTCRSQVKQYFAAITGRRNTITGQLYRDDPSIMSWNVLNEARCSFCGPEAVDSWIGEMSAYLKSVAPNQLVTTGAEGFFDVSHPMAGYNPASWADYSGQDFRANHAHPGIDYATLHMWPDNWGRAQDMSFGERWIQAHAQVASELGKPLLVEEFGKEADEGSISSVRDPWFQMVHRLLDSSLTSGGSLRGSLFWQWDGPWGPAKGSRSSKSNYVHLEDSTFTQHVIPFARRLSGIAAAAQPVPGCMPRTSSGSSSASSSSSAGGGSALGNSTRLASPAVQSFGGASNNRRLMHKE